MAGGRRGRAAAAVGLAVAAAATAAMAPPRAVARPLQMEDLLQREEFGAVAVTPGGRWLLVEQRGPYAAAARFDYGQKTAMFRTRLRVADLSRRGGLRPLFRPEPGVGYQLGPIAPDGARAVVFRLRADRWEVGVASLATRTVRWLDVTGEWQFGAHAVAWLSPTELAVIARARSDNPFLVRAMRPQAPLPRLWAASAAGQTAALAVGSGRFVAERPHSALKQLLRISVATGARRVLARGDFSDLEVSASGRWLAILEAAEDIPLQADHAVQGAYGVAVRRQRLGLVDLVRGTVSHPCAPCDLLASLLSWAPATDDLLIYARADGAPWAQGRLLRLTAATGALTRPGDGLQPRLSHRPEVIHSGWWGADPLVVGRLPGAARDDWFRLTPAGPVNLTRDLLQRPADGGVLTGGGLLVAAGDAAWRLDARGQARPLAAGAFSPLTRSFDHIADRAAYQVAPGTALTGVVDAGGARAAAAIGAHGQVLARSPLGPRDRLLAASPAGETLVVDRVSGGGQETLEVRKASAPPQPLARINRRYLTLDWPRALPVRHDGPDGQRLQSWLLLPPHAPGAPPPPLVVFPYPGSSYSGDPSASVFWGARPTDPTAVLVGHGYAVLLPSLPNPQHGDGPADHLADRVLAIVDAAAADPSLRGAFDPRRLGVWGYSFGGYAALAMIAQTDRFGAAVADASPTDLFGMEGVFGPDRRVFADEGVSTPWIAGWTEDLQGGMGGPPWRDPGRYVRNSPALQADRIHTPVLLIHGEQDNIPLPQSEEMFSALYRQNKDAMLVTYWGEGHIMSSPGNLRDYARRALAWLDAGLAFRPVTSDSAAPPRRPGSGSANAGPRTRRPRPGAATAHPPSR